MPPRVEVERRAPTFCIILLMFLPLLVKQTMKFINFDFETELSWEVEVNEIGLAVCFFFLYFSKKIK